MRIIRADETMAEQLGVLNAEFRAVLRSYKGIESEPDIPAGIEEIREFIKDGSPVFAAEENGEYAGYILCRIEAPCVWAEHLYVREKYRRQGIAGLLFDEAEKIAKALHEDTVYVNIHPNNDAVIAFLRSRGYTVMNLIEVRKPYAKERLRMKIRVNSHSFDY